MFLNVLKDQNKELFLELCLHLSNSDGVFADSEKEVLKAYCKEMEITEKTDFSMRPLENVVSILNNNANLVEKKIVIMELLALAYVDGIYDENEKEEMNIIISGLEFSENQVKEIIELLNKYINICDEIKNYLCVEG